MDKEQAVFEQLPNFKGLQEVEFHTIKDLQYKISDKIRISCVWCFCLWFCLFLVYSTGCTGEFQVVFKHFQNLENLMSNILKEKLHISCLVSLQ